MFNTGAKLTAFCLVLRFFGSIFHVQSCDEDCFNHHNITLMPEDDTCGPVSHSPRVVGGKDATLGEFPWMAILFSRDASDRTRSALLCGGSIITSRHVLTAAHCIPEYPLEISHVRVGEHDLSCTSDCEASPKDVQVSRVVKHEGYDSDNNNDIAIIYLQSPLDFNSYVAPICLPIYEVFKSKGHHSNTTLQVAGWGIMDIDNHKMATVLQTVTLPYVTHDECQDIYSERDITQYQLCAGGVEGEDSCNGDSGGPLMGLYSVSQGPERYFLLGITSFGPIPCGSTSPAVYTNVARYAKWIIDNL